MPTPTSPQRALPATARPVRAHVGSASDRPANSYTPQFMAEMTISVTATGGLVTGWVASVPECLTFESVSALIAALQDLGYPYTETFDFSPFEPAPGTSFAGGPRDGFVPWLGISPVPVINGQWRTDQGAFAVNAGVFANYWNHGVHPFVGSSYEADLRADVQRRVDSAKQGMPII